MRRLGSGLGPASNRVGERTFLYRSPREAAFTRAEVERPSVELPRKPVAAMVYVDIFPVALSISRDSSRSPSESETLNGAARWAFSRSEPGRATPVHAESARLEAEGFCETSLAAA